MKRRIIGIAVAGTLALLGCTGQESPAEGFGPAEAAELGGDAGKDPSSLENPRSAKPDEVDEASGK